MIELVVVVAVLGILAAAAIALVDPLSQIQKANDSKRKSDLNQIRKGLELYYQNNARYPDTVSPTDYRIKSLVPDQGAIDWGTPWPPFMDSLPKDPSSSKKYIYVVSPTGQAYYLYANLDRGGKDTMACNVGGTDCSSVPVANACGSGKPCNYGITSPNVSP